MVSVWDHKTAQAHGAARIVVPNHLYRLIEEQASGDHADLVFKTSAGGKVTHIGMELDKLAEHFGKKFGVSLKKYLIYFLINAVIVSSLTITLLSLTATFVYSLTILSLATNIVTSCRKRLH